MIPDLAVYHPVDFVVKIDGAPVSCIRTTVIITVELFHWDAVFLYSIFFLYACAEYCRLVGFQKAFSFVLAYVVYDYGSAWHVGHHSFIVPEFYLVSFQGFELFGAYSRVVSFRVFFNLELLYISAVCIYF